MLVLSRKTDEKVIITMPDDRTIEVLLVATERGKVRLGFLAPADVRIYRSEVQDRIDAEAKRGG